MKKKIVYSHYYRPVFAIGHVTFHEVLRQKILWSAMVFAGLSVGLAFAVSQLSFAENSRIALDFGLTSISLVGGLISVILGSSLIAKEVHDRTLYLVLTKPVWRWQFVLGRFVGLMGVLAVNSMLMMLALLVVYKITGGFFSLSILKCFMLQIAEFGMLAAMASIFSSFSTATVAAIMASGIWVLGHAMSDLKILAMTIEPNWMRPVLAFVSRVLPDLTRLDVKVLVSHDLPLTWAYTASSVAYGLAYVAFALVAACIVFSGREL